MLTPDHESAAAEVGAAVTVLVADPLGGGAGAGWQVGSLVPPSAPHPAAARAARLEARLAVYAQYATVVAEEAAAAVAGDEASRAALTMERGAAAEHFAELREPADADGLAAGAFSDALTDALHELRHQDAVDDALGRRLRALRDAAASRNATSREPIGALPAGEISALRHPAVPRAAAAPQLDLRF